MNITRTIITRRAEFHGLCPWVNGVAKMKLNWGRKTKTERQEEYPTKDVFLMCNLIRVGKLNEYLEWLEKRPKKEIINKFLDIIYSKNSWFPIAFQEETPPVVIDGISFDSIQNRVGRIMTKISLLLLVHDESKKLGIWNQLQPQWTEKYILEAKILVRIEEGIAKQLEDTGQGSRAADLRKHIEGIKESNKKYAIDWDSVISY
jgi:hypothetical protein